MKIDTITGPAALEDRWAIRTRYERAEELAEAHKWFYEKAIGEGLYHPDTKISVVKKKMEVFNFKLEVLAFQADMPDLELLGEPTIEHVEKERVEAADDIRHKAYRFLDMVCRDDYDPSIFVNHAAIDNYSLSMGYDKSTDRVYLTTLILINDKYPSEAILARYKEETGIDLTLAGKKRIPLRKK